MSYYEVIEAAEASKQNDAEPVQLYDIVDERAAAFFALGQARLSARPSLLLCTSGTAAAHYLPAIVEAAMTAVPMLVLSADRPPELTGCGANQTIDQNRLFGEHARAFVELGLADAHPGALRGVRRRIHQAVFTASWPRPGAVHINARARKPLEPPQGDGPSGPKSTVERRVDQLLERPSPKARRPRRQPAATDLGDLANDLRRFERGVIVAGPAAADQADCAERLLLLSRRTGLPLLADLASQLRSTKEPVGPLIVASEAVLRSDAWPSLRPDLVVQIGRTPTATAWVQRLAQHPPDAHWVLGPHDWHDPESTATDLLAAELAESLDGLLERLPEKPPTDWLRRWCRAGRAADGAVESVLESGDELSEAQTAREAVAAVPEGGLLKLGNSLAIRHADLYGGRVGEGVTVLSQRGASGIDGLVAGAAGAATSGRPTLLLLGDVSLQHDLGGLMTAPRDGTPFIVVVIDNGGGRIFEQLPIARRIDAQALTHWLTPPTGDLRDFAHAAAFAGFGYSVATTRPGLRQELAAAFETGGPHLIVARVPASGAVELRRRLDAKMAEEMAARLAKTPGEESP